MTAQEIREKTFEKALFGGYVTENVDSFLEQMTNEYEALTKENQDLKKKLKILVAKIDEYRGAEDALRDALLSAQKLSNQITSEAKASAEATTADATSRAEAMLSEARRRSEMTMRSAEVEAERIVTDAKNAITAEEAALASAKRSTSQYVREAKWLCSRLMSVLENPGAEVLPEEDLIAEAPAPAPEPEPAPAETAPAAEQPAAEAEAEPEAVSEDISDTVRSIERYLSAMTQPAGDPSDDEAPQFSFGAVFDHQA